jgi:hypothetical protein
VLLHAPDGRSGGAGHGVCARALPLHREAQACDVVRVHDLPARLRSGSTRHNSSSRANTACSCSGCRRDLSGCRGELSGYYHRCTTGTRVPTEEKLIEPLDLVRLQVLEAWAPPGYDVTDADNAIAVVAGELDAEDVQLRKRAYLRHPEIHP